MKYLLLFTLFSICFVSTQNVSAYESCETFSGKDKYDCQVKNHCQSYKPEVIHYPTTEYDFSKNRNLLETGKSLYRENQNGIYSCAILQIQKNSFENISKTMIKVDKTGTLSAEVLAKIQLKLSKLAVLTKNKKCHVNTDREFQNKKEVLIESTFEMCKYRFYLDTIKEYYDNNLSQSLPEQTGSGSTYNVSEIAQIATQKEQAIEDEIDHTYEVFELAFQAYTEYEANLGPHLLLELIKQDFIVLRIKLHQVLGPINQVVYKIQNAMSTKD